MAPHGESSQYKGVTKDGNRWKAQIQIGGVEHHLGRFPLTTEGEVAAARAYDRAAVEARRLAARGRINFPIEDYAELLSQEELRQLSGLGSVSMPAIATTSRCGTAHRPTRSPPTAHRRPRRRASQASSRGPAATSQSSSSTP
jgi:hypothetical protein